MRKPGAASSSRTAGASAASSSAAHAAHRANQKAGERARLSKRLRTWRAAAPNRLGHQIACHETPRRKADHHDSSPAQPDGPMRSKPSLARSPVAPRRSRHYRRAMPRDGESSPPGRPVASVARALALLDELGAAPDGLGVNELARRIGVNASTASRLLATLQAGRMVERARAAGRTASGWGSSRSPTASSPASTSAISPARGCARSWTRRGRPRRCRCRAPAEAVTVDFVAAESSVMSVARLGRPSIGHATAAGKVVLAFGAGPRRDRGGAHAPTPSARSSTPRARPRRSSGCARAAGPRRRASASPTSTRWPSPVFGRSGELAAVLGLQGPAARLTAARRAEVLPALLDAAAGLQRALGG